MSLKQATDLADYLMSKSNIILLVGSLATEIDFNGKKLLDYAVDIARTLKVPVAATGNTSLDLKARGVSPLTKMWAFELISYLRFPWKEEITRENPEVLIFLGYSPVAAQKLASSVNNIETVVLGNTYVAGATYSFPDSTSIYNWQQSLEDLLSALGNS